MDLGSYFNFLFLGEIGERDMACKLEKNDTHDYIVFLEGRVNDLTLSSPPILTEMRTNTGKLSEAATACSYRKFGQ